MYGRNMRLEQDTALVQSARNGCDEAFAVLIDRYRPIVYGSIWSLLHHRDDAEDATQETFVRAYRRLEDLREDTRFASWLYTIAMNTARKRLGQRALEDQRLARLGRDYRSLRTPAEPEEPT